MVCGLDSILVERPSDVLRQVESFTAYKSCVFEMFDVFGKVGNYVRNGGSPIRGFEVAIGKMQRHAESFCGDGSCVYALEFDDSGGTLPSLAKVGMTSGFKRRMSQVKSQVKRHGANYKHSKTAMVIPCKNEGVAMYLENMIHSALHANGCFHSGDYFRNDVGFIKVMVAFFAASIAVNNKEAC